MRGLAAAVIALALALPVAIVLTFLLLPFWRWLEDGWGIEAVGHASLSEWCFVATWLVLGTPLALLAHRAFRRRGAARDPAA
ncbi:hypothetical protein [Cognatilysobacter segetis]|uniref:hypothetical protein n=1 Tax=Cognatilysobacter segetis TaxID=2492394 RepID=UPI00105ED014|nr:hypothetical protein [Lysobacter segetis]